MVLFPSDARLTKSPTQVRSLVYFIQIALHTQDSWSYWAEGITLRTPVVGFVFILRGMSWSKSKFHLCDFYSRMFLLALSIFAMNLDLTTGLRGFVVFDVSVYIVSIV